MIKVIIIMIMRMTMVQMLAGEDGLVLVMMVMMVMILNVMMMPIIKSAVDKEQF